MDAFGSLVPPGKPLPRIPSPSNLSSGQPILGARPLSDIREITEPSLLDSSRRKGTLESQRRTQQQLPEPSKQARSTPISKLPLSSGELPAGLNGVPAANQTASQNAPAATARPNLPARRNRWSPERSTEDDTTKSSAFTINLKHVPPRSSSKPRRRSGQSRSRTPAVAVLSSGIRRSCSNRRQSNSPFKDVAHGDWKGEALRQRIPSKTLVKVDSPILNDILVSPIYHHPRLRLEIHMAASLFVGGSTVEGVVRIIVDEATRLRHRKTLAVDRLSVDLVGVEEVSEKRSIFLSLGNELLDGQHPPPDDMVESQVLQPTHRHSWLLIPSVTKLPFLLTLPLEVGPPSFKSKNANIRYLLSSTLFLRDTGRQLCVRTTQETFILSVYDPERALVSLPSPLTSSDEVLLRRGREKVTVAAGLHRQVWVNGTTLFADVHIVNNSRKPVKKIELQLEQIILFYRHAAASTLEQSASQSRLFDDTERTTICSTTVKQHDVGWPGVASYSTDLHTCSIDIPRGFATIKCNKYFEVRYLLNVVVPVSHSFTGSRKFAMIQLPIILIHMASLDVPTNSVAQVAAAIQDKRNPGNVHHSAKLGPNSKSVASSTAASTTLSDAAAARGSPQRRVGRKPSQNIQGRAFAAPRTASLERSRAQQRDIQDLGQALDESPRKFQRHQQAPGREVDVVRAAQATGVSDAGHFSYRTPPHNRQGTVIQEEDAEQLQHRIEGDNEATRSFKVIPPAPLSMPRGREEREPPRSASAMGYYMPGDDSARLRTKENRRPSGDAGRTSHIRRSLDAVSSAHPRPAVDLSSRARSSAEEARPRPKEWRDGGRSPVGGVQLTGVPEAPRRNGSTTERTADWSVKERERWRPHWL